MATMKDFNEAAKRSLDGDGFDLGKTLKVIVAQSKAIKDSKRIDRILDEAIAALRDGEIATATKLLINMARRSRVDENYWFLMYMNELLGLEFTHAELMEMCEDVLRGGLE